MKKTTHIILTLLFTLFTAELLIAQGECVIIVQGERDKDDDHFIKNSVDILAAGLGARSPAPTITILRPKGETGSGSNYENKADLIAKIKAALCNEKCKDVVIALIGHGIGSAGGVVNKPSDKNAGGMKIGKGNMDKDILKSPDVAALIDSCKKAVKIISSQCFAESMINGICAVILNKHLIGVAIGSSLWDEESKASGEEDDASDYTYDFIVNFLKDYYLIIGNPVVMDDLKKAAEDLKKKNKETNETVEAENKAAAQKIKDLDQMIKTLKQDIEKMTQRRDALNKKKKLTDKEQKELDKLNEDIPKMKGELFEKQLELEKLINTPPKSPIPEHLPLEELIIHEAFKSAESMTTSSHGVEPVKPTSTGKVDVPSTPPTDVTKGDERFVFYKTKDKKGNCIVVGYRADKHGNPIGPLKSIECDLECKKTKFSYSDNGTTKVVEATLQQDDEYKYTIDGVEVIDFRPAYKKMDLIKPGELLAEVYCQVEFNRIADIIVPGWQVSNAAYDDTQWVLNFNIGRESNTHQIEIAFQPHEDAMISIDQNDSYLASHAKRYTLIDMADHSTGKLGIIFLENGIEGTVQLCVNDPPQAVIGQLSSDLHRFMLSSTNTSFPFQANPHFTNPSLMLWSMFSHQGILYQDTQNEPEIVHFNLTRIPNSPNSLAWQYNVAHLTDTELGHFNGTMVIAFDLPNAIRKYPLIPPDKHDWTDPQQNPNTEYHIYPVMLNNTYCVAYQGILYDEFGHPHCTENQGNTNLTNHSNVYGQKYITNEITVFPNPFRQSTELHFSLELDQQIQLRIFNLAGSIIDQRKINASKGWNVISISKEDLKNAGLYFYELKTNNKSFKGKLILER